MKCLKQWHVTLKAAKAARASLIVSGKVRGRRDCRALTAYLCERCGSYHVGRDYGLSNAWELEKVAKRFERTGMPQHLTRKPVEIYEVDAR